MPKMNKVQLRHDVFARGYVIDQNGTKAAIAAGYKKKGAHVQASRLLRNAKVQDLISKYAERIAKKLDVTAERVLGELAKVAFLDPRKLYREDGSLIPIKHLDPDVAAALTGIEVDESVDYRGRGTKKRSIGTTTIKIRFAHKTPALQALGNHLKLFEPGTQAGTEDPLLRLIALMELRSKQIGPPEESVPQLLAPEDQNPEQPTIEIEAEETIAP